MTLKEKTIRVVAAVACCVLISVCPFEITFAAVNEQAPNKPEELIEVKVYNLSVDHTNQSPVVLLSDSDEKQALPIWISPFEANAIYVELADIKPYRPQTHELLKRIIQKVKGTVRRIVITHVKENLYYAVIVMETEGTLIEIDARPSDSIVLALKFNAPIFVAKSLFNEMSIAIEEKKEAIKQYGLALQDLTPALAQYFSFESISGVLVSDVRSGSNAEKDGLKTGDVIVEIENESIKNMDSLKNVISRGITDVRAKIYRQNEFIFLRLRLK